MWSFSALCDEFTISSRLYLKLELTPSRETVLHLFEQVRRQFPRMTRMRRRDDGGLVLDEEPGEGEQRRFLRVDATTVRFGYANAPEARAVGAFADAILTQAPVHLSLSDLDYDFLEVAYTFDLEYRGNHDEIIAETLFAEHPLLGLLAGNGHRVIDCQPFVGATLTSDCERQVYVEVKGRTSTFEVRTGEFEPLPLSTIVTLRHYWGVNAPRELATIHRELLKLGERFASERVIPTVVQPLAAAIASRR